MQTNRVGTTQSAFTLIELLVVIAIISILAAILFPVFATVRESARQSSTMTNMHTVYLGARLYYEDEGHYPSSLFGYAEAPTGGTNPAAYVLLSDTAGNVTPMDQATGNFATSGGINKGYLYREQVKDFNTFVNAINPVAKQQNGKTQVTTVSYPTTLPTLASGAASLAGQPVVWGSAAATGTCPKAPDADTPNFSGFSYNNIPKIFYKMDSMDIGPALTTDSNGNVIPVVDSNKNYVYELHYSPDWTKERFDPSNGCDEVVVNGKPTAIVAQLKYKNPPTERTVLTYITDHVAYNNNNKVLILLMSGTARAMDAKQAINPNSGHVLPLGY